MVSIDDNDKKEEKLTPAHIIMKLNANSELIVTIKLHIYQGDLVAVFVLG